MKQLDAATRRYSETKQAHEEASSEAKRVVLSALQEGRRPTDVARRSPFTAAYVRRVARENGIEGDQRYVREVKEK